MRRIFFLNCPFHISSIITLNVNSKISVISGKAVGTVLGVVLATRGAETKGPQNGYLKEKLFFFVQHILSY
jgi:hypothetical protein